MAASNRRRPSPARGRRKARRMRSGMRTASLFYRIVAAVFIVAIIVIGAFAIKNFSVGEKNYKLGTQAMDAGNYEQAVTYFQTAIDADSRNATYREALGTAQIEATQYDAAVQTFQTLTDGSTSTKKEMGWRGIGIAYLYQGNYSSAQEAFEQAISYVSGKYTDLELDIAYYLAEAQTLNNDPVGAVLTYTEIIDRKSDADAYMLRGMAYQKVGDNTSAEADLVKAIDMSKQSFKVYMALYQIYQDQGKDSEAQKLLAEATQLTPKTAEDYSNRGLLWMYMGSYENAEADLNTAIDKGYAMAYFGKAELYMEQGRYEDAVTLFGSYFVQETGNALAYNQYGVCLMQLERYQEAQAAFATGIELNDRTLDQTLRFNEITALERQGDWTTALEKAKTYVEKYPSDEAGQKEYTFIESRQY